MLRHSGDLKKKESLNTVVSNYMIPLVLQALTSKAHSNISYMVSGIHAVEMMRRERKELSKMTFSMFLITYQQRMSNIYLNLLGATIP